MSPCPKRAPPLFPCRGFSWASRTTTSKNGDTAAALAEHETGPPGADCALGHLLYKVSNYFFEVYSRPRLGQERCADGAGPTAARCVFQSFRDQVHKCTPESEGLMEQDRRRRGVFFKVSETKCPSAQRGLKNADGAVGASIWRDRQRVVVPRKRVIHEISGADFFGNEKSKEIS